MVFLDRFDHLKHIVLTVLMASLPAAIVQATTPDTGPVPSSAQNIAAGRQIFIVNCSACHGPDGRAQVQAMAKATDLTHPEWFKKGPNDAAIFSSIQNGLGNGMPAHKDILSAVETWKVVNFIRSIQAPAKSQ
jgi:mono/diheme cytochrome c family protein